MMFPNDTVLFSTLRHVVEEKLEQWRAILEDSELKISRKKTEYLIFNDDEDCEIRLTETKLKSEDKIKYLVSVVTGY